MEKNFSLTISKQEKSWLKELAKLSIARVFNRQDPEKNIAVPPGEILTLPLGAFVTLKKSGNLRGCIGRLSDPAPLYMTVARMAVAAAFGDPRFPELSADEFKNIELEISIMGPITKCPDPDLIQVGRHGLIMKKDHQQGLLLPQVPIEWGWNREEFLRRTCQKAGLLPDAWKDGSTEILWFEAEII